MPYATASDGVRLWYEEAGAGTPVVFVHEFGGDHRSWEPQMRFFSRRHRCVTFGARGYPPSDVPEDLESYSQEIAATDIVAVMDALAIPKAHVVGLSMGGFATLHLGLAAPGRALSLVVAGAGYGAEKQHEAYFRNVSLEVARQFEAQGAETFAKTYAQAGGGRSALRARRDTPPERKLACLTLDRAQDMVLGREPVLHAGKPVGYVTSANSGYSVGRNIAYALLPAALAVPGCAVEIEYFDAALPATVAAEPLFDPHGARLRA